MKKTWIRLLSVLLAAVMIFPAAAFAEPFEGVLYYDSPKYNTMTLSYEGTIPEGAELVWSSDDTTIATVAPNADNPALAVVTGKSTGTAHVELKNKTTFEQLDFWAVEVKQLSETKTTLKTNPSKTTYVAGEKFDPSGASFTVTYNTGDEREIKWGDSGLTCDKAGIALATTDKKVVYSYGKTDIDVEIAVVPKEVFSVAIIDDKDEYTVGDVISGVEVLVTYNDRSTLTIKSGYTVTPSGKLTTDVKSYTVTYEGITSAPRTITVKAKENEGSGSGSGSDTTTDDYKLTAITTNLKKKSYAVGDTFETDGLSVQVTNKNGAYVATLSGTSGINAILAAPYTFTTNDLSPTTGTTRTSTISLTVWYNNKPYSVPVSGLTVTPAKKTLTLRTTGSVIDSRSIEVTLKKNFYPVGSKIELSEVSKITGIDGNGDIFSVTYADFSSYTNRFSLEVATLDSRKDPVGKSTTSSYRNTLMDSDVFTDNSGKKYAYVRLYIDNYYTDVMISTGESPVAVYSSSSYSNSYLLETYEDLYAALEDVNDLNHKWGSSGTTVLASRTLYIKLGQDDIIGRYDYMTPARDIEIDLNGYNLTMYSDTFRFMDRYDDSKVTVTNSSSTTSKVVYDNLSDVGDLLLDKSEKLVYEYKDRNSAVIPGVYTITLSELKFGTVTAKPAVSNKGTITVAHGNDVTFTITPDKDYQIDTVKQKLGTASETTVNTNTNSNYSLNSQTGAATYTLKDVQRDATFTVTFKAVQKEEEKKEETKEWTNPFSDVSNYASYYEAVKYVNQNGLMNGMTASSFGPNQTMTRAQFVTTLGRMYLGSIFQTTAEKDAAMVAQYGTDSQFSDVSYSDASLSYAVPYIKWAESSGLVLGYGNGKFGPKDTITHQQMYIIMYRYAQLEGKSINVNSVTLRATDAGKIGENWAATARDSAIVAAKYGQQQGFLVNSMSIDPDGNALRYELAILLRQFSVNVLGRQ